MKKLMMLSMIMLSLGACDSSDTITVPDVDIDDPVVSCTGVDSIPPVLVDMELVSDTVNISTSDANVIIRARMTDGCTGIHVFGGALRLPSGIQHIAQRATSPINGTVYDGTWEISITIPKNSPIGDYRIKIFAIDGAGNISTPPWNYATLPTLGFPGFVTVIS